MKPYVLLILSLIVVATCSSVFAGQYSDALGACLADNTSGKDRKELARWIFVAMSAHPEMKNLSNVPDGQRDRSSKEVATLFMRLLTETCASQTKAAMQNEGSTSIASAFKTLGALAMQELMANQEVQRSIASLDQFIDRSKLEKVMSPK